jgi:NADH-quinone oxidoreductase subunit G
VEDGALRAERTGGMTKLIVDGKEIDVLPEYTLLQACEAAGAEIPRFCFHERLSIAGNCRMCLIEVVGIPKPQASCAMGVKDLMPNKDGSPKELRTRSPMVRKAREGVMEFLLINHPLDCPICDQGGECDLQDQSMAYGIDSSRFHENKRAVEDKYLGALVKTSMNRCIQCTRCVRFSAEVAGVPELGATGRGEDMEITTYLEQAMRSELQGNVVDICPVGALTAKPYAFAARPWELGKTESIDVMDALGSAIRIDTRGREVMRILPRANDDINEEWISDKTRHVVDGLRTQRLDQAYVRENGQLRPASWSEAFNAIARKLARANPKRVGALVGDLAAVEEIFALKDLMTRLGVNNLDCRQDGSALDPRWGRASYLFNATIAGIEAADALVIVGSNPRKEAAVLNARIRKRWRAGNFPVGLIGSKTDLTYGYDYLGAGPETLAAIARHSFADTLRKAERPLLLVGAAAFARADGAAIASLAAKAAVDLGAVKEGWNGYSVLHTGASRVGALDLGFVPGEGALNARQMATSGALDVVFLLGVDELEIAPGAFAIYIGSNGDRGATRADVILPGAAYPEKSAIYVNTEGRVQMAARASFPPGDAREDWAILRALSDVLGKRLPYDSLAALRQALFKAHPHFQRIGEIAAGDAVDVQKLAALGGGGTERVPFRSSVNDFYFTNAIARCSAVMAECSALAHGRAAVTAAESRRVMAAFWSDYIWPLVIMVAESLLLLIILLITVAYVLYADRKIWAAVQIRRGPNVVGPWGLFQSFADLIKFVLKEPVIPAGANKGVFLIAPLVACTLALAAWAVIPVNAGWVIANINVGILYIFAISSLGVYGIIMAGWASNSKYPFLAALRSAAQMVSYEVSIGFVIITVLLCVGSLNLTAIVEAQDSAWGLLRWYWLPLFPMLVIFFVSALAETNRPPFDLVEAESELVAGFMVEYGSTPYMMFMLGEYVAVTTMCAMCTILFFGGWLPPFPVVPFTWVPGVIWFVLKASFVFFMFAMVKAFVPRYRYDQLMRLGWKVFLPISLAMVVIVAGVLQIAQWAAK